jgi:hypothetical protein
MHGITQKGHFSACIALFVMCLCSCDPEPDLVTSETDYFPTRVGDYRIFHVIETQVTAYNIETDYEYDIKTVVVDSFSNAQGTYSFIVNRFKGEIISNSWQSLDTWIIRADNREVVVTEGSTPFVRLAFPLQNKRTWNGNAYNNQESSEFCEGDTFTSCDQYELANVAQPFTTPGGATFNKTIEIIQNNDPDLITEYDIRKEVYARHIGLVFKSTTLLKYCTIGNCLGQQLVENGLIFTQELIEYGHQ